jgi:hypothetical protein
MRNIEKIREREREREKEIKTICCSNCKTASVVFQSSAYLSTHIEDVICIFSEQVKKRFLQFVVCIVGIIR